MPRTLSFAWGPIESWSASRIFLRPVSGALSISSRVTSRSQRLPPIQPRSMAMRVNRASRVTVNPLSARWFCSCISPPTPNNIAHRMPSVIVQCRMRDAGFVFRFADGPSPLFRRCPFGLDRQARFADLLGSREVHCFHSGKSPGSSSLGGGGSFLIGSQGAGSGLTCPL